MLHSFGRLRPYFQAALLAAATDVIMLIGDRDLVRYLFPWATVSLLAVALAAILWGTGPAVLVLVLAVLFGDVIAPDLHISFFPSDQQLGFDVRFVRAAFFSLCGFVLIYFIQRSKQLSKTVERRGEVLHALQAMTIPDVLPDVPGWDVACYYRPASEDDEVGGDFYDIFSLDSHRARYGLLIGDVMGKGKEAAVNTAALRYGARTHCRIGSSPSQALSRLDQTVDSDGLLTTTMFLGVLDAESGCVMYANAGHEPAILVRQDGTVEMLEATGPVLGVGLGVRYEDRRSGLNPGDTLVMLTDGVTESRNADREFLTQDALQQTVAQAAKRPTAREALECIADVLDSFTGGDRNDDIAMVVLRRS